MLLTLICRTCVVVHRCLKILCNLFKKNVIKNPKPTVYCLIL